MKFDKYTIGKLKRIAEKELFQPKYYIELDQELYELKKVRPGE